METVIYDIENKEFINGRVMRLKVTPSTPLPKLPATVPGAILVTSGRLPHWRHVQAVEHAIEESEFDIIATYDPILNGAVVVWTNEENEAYPRNKIIPIVFAA